LWRRYTEIIWLRNSFVLHLSAGLAIQSATLTIPADFRYAVSQAGHDARSSFDKSADILSFMPH
jgi:hypothetical protein